MKIRAFLQANGWFLLPFLPFLWFLKTGWPSDFGLAVRLLTTAGSFALTIFLFEKSLHALHFGTRFWTRSLFALLAVGLCPIFWSDLFLGQSGHFWQRAFAATLLLFSLRSLENEDANSGGLAWLTAILGIQILDVFPTGLEPILLAVGLLFVRQKRWIWLAISLLGIGLAGCFFIEFEWSFWPENDWGWSRLWPVLLPIWPNFWLFLPIFLFFLKKTDWLPLPKRVLAASIFFNIGAAILWPSTGWLRLDLAFWAMLILSYPVFERGLLYGLYFVKKWKMWSLVGLAAAVQLAVIFWILSGLNTP